MAVVDEWVKLCVRAHAIRCWVATAPKKGDCQTEARLADARSSAPLAAWLERLIYHYDSPAWLARDASAIACVKEVQLQANQAVSAALWGGHEALALRALATLPPWTDWSAISYEASLTGCTAVLAISQRKREKSARNWWYDRLLRLHEALRARGIDSARWVMPTHLRLLAENAQKHTQKQCIRAALRGAPELLSQLDMQTVATFGLHREMNRRFSLDGPTAFDRAIRGAIDGNHMHLLQKLLLRFAEYIQILDLEYAARFGRLRMLRMMLAAWVRAKVGRASPATVLSFMMTLGGLTIRDDLIGMENAGRFLAACVRSRSSPFAPICSTASHGFAPLTTALYRRLH